MQLLPSNPASARPRSPKQQDPKNRRMAKQQAADRKAARAAMEASAGGVSPTPGQIERPLSLPQISRASSSMEEQPPPRAASVAPTVSKATAKRFAQAEAMLRRQVRSQWKDINRSFKQAVRFPPPPATARHPASRRSTLCLTPNLTRPALVLCAGPGRDGLDHRGPAA